MRIFSDITALTAFNRNASGVNAVFVGIKALTAFYYKITGVSGFYAAMLKKIAAYSQRSSTRVFCTARPIFLAFRLIFLSKHSHLTQG